MNKLADGFGLILTHAPANQHHKVNSCMGRNSNRLLLSSHSLLTHSARLTSSDSHTLLNCQRLFPIRAFTTSDAALTYPEYVLMCDALLSEALIAAPASASAKASKKKKKGHAMFRSRCCCHSRSWSHSRFCSGEDGSGRLQKCPSP